MRILTSVLARTALAATLVAGPAVAAQAEMVLHIGNLGEPDTLDPHHASGTWENRIIGDMFLGLLTEAADGTVIPGAATSWQISDDGLTYTFNLRDGATWSDGVPVTADDFVFALRRILEPELAARYASILYPIKNAEALNGGTMTGMENLGARAVNDGTLEITLAAPTPFFLELLTHYTAFPVPKHKVEAHGDDWVKPGNMVTNGAYVLSEWLSQTHVVTVKSDTFYDAANVAIDKVVFYPSEDRNAALRRFRAGEFDMNTDFPSEQIDWLKANMPDETRISPYLGIYYYPINHNDPAMQDERIRAALSMAIDRGAITEQVLKTGEIPAESFVPPLPGYEVAKMPFLSMSQAERVAEAKSLMEAAGYSASNPLDLTLRYNTSENHKRIAVAVSAMWKQIHVNANLHNADVAVHYNDLEQGDFQVARAGWVADYPDAQNFLFLLQTNAGVLNYGRYSVPEFDSLMEQASLTTDLEARARIMQEAEAIALADYANIPIYYYVSKNMVGTHVSGFVDNAKDIHRTRWMSVAR
ncbi:MAG: peptide ABC transporter substrate-binding protein [Inquilinus sp.]|nr:peptide ABC transporter substrate-binding protein [Inquilinus sp.]